METTNNLEHMVESGYLNLSNYVENILLYKGKSISQWSEELTLPAVPDNADAHTMLALNQRAIKLIDTVYTHLGISRAVLVGAKAAYNKKYNLQITSIRDGFNETNKDGKKRLTNDALEHMATNQCLNEASTLAVAEFFYEFWKSQVDKVEAFNTRLTSLNISKHNEQKYTNNSIV